jgi:8-oxo-dGTP pyrophosphatase MutT (NUDIX family)
MNRVQVAFSPVLLGVELAEQVSRQAAVALIFVQPDCPRLVMIKRSIREGDPWSGQMAFPGGHRDGDESLIETAKRETLEEIGVDLSTARLLGALPTLTLPKRLNLPNMVIHPFGFSMDSLPETDLNFEVASIHSFALDDLYDGVGRGEFVWQKENRPITLPEVRLGGVKIWGISLRIIDQMLGLI